VKIELTDDEVRHLVELIEDQLGEGNYHYWRQRCRKRFKRILQNLEAEVAAIRERQKQARQTGRLKRGMAERGEDSRNANAKDR
jgi:hypothetical protein